MQSRGTAITPYTGSCLHVKLHTPGKNHFIVSENVSISYYDIWIGWHGNVIQISYSLTYCIIWSRYIFMFIVAPARAQPIFSAVHVADGTVGNFLPPGRISPHICSLPRCLDSTRLSLFTNTRTFCGRFTAHQQGWSRNWTCWVDDAQARLARSGL